MANTPTILAVDCGNSRVHFGILPLDAAAPGGAVASVAAQLPAAKTDAPFAPVLATWSLPVPFRAAACAAAFDEHLPADVAIEAVVCASVNPKATEPVAGWARERFGREHFIRLGRDIPIPIANRTDYPDQVGHDRLVNSVAVAAMFPGEPALVIDIGTGVTFDIVSKDGEYLGGTLVPGLRLAARALYDHTALLPLIETDKPPAEAPPYLGRNTRAAIESGLYNGYVGLVTALIDGLTAELGGGRPRMIGTGGDAAAILERVDGIERIVSDITLQGIRLCYLRAGVR